MNAKEFAAIVDSSQAASLIRARVASNGPERVMRCSIGVGKDSIDWTWSYRRLAGNARRS
jgi:hypothetical protein